MPEKPGEQQKDLLTQRWRNVIRPKREDRSLHIPLVSILRWAIKPGVIWRHVPNGEYREPKIAAKLKAMGVLPGSADLEFFWNSARTPIEPCLAMLFMELKIGRRFPISQAQQQFRQRVVEIGARVAVHREHDARREIPARGRVAHRGGVRVEGLRPHLGAERGVHLAVPVDAVAIRDGRPRVVTAAPKTRGGEPCQ